MKDLRFGGISFTLFREIEEFFLVRKNMLLKRDRHCSEQGLKG